ncbi:SDR family NAD(P)-dependent oxidoreductase [Gordonia rhizosphera]|uniref:Putative oxidoreductase n=1 Tax=Gordonia rhizosphera NBRC 16068 TaxID=1108045 RepID=K6VSE4_9ACTN|nr:SDR family NAD(P)-dependent oxidoreductase [Gordonia rhizosphera]GAB89790.1 putative oxidoreductase [Gordonia rhizosphera NBRC 16068]
MTKNETLAKSEQAADSLAGKVAVVTGAARGIGLEVARSYAAHGAKVVISDIDDAAAADAAGTVPDASARRCDVRDEDSVSDLIDHTLNLHGQVDIVVANAGIASVSPLAEMSFEMWRTMMSINLDGVFLTVKHAARAMIAAGTPGSIITVGSVTALHGTPLVGHYGAAKAAVVNLSKTAALELRPHGIRVNSILPGFAETALVTSNKQSYSDTVGVDFDAIIKQAQGGYVSVEDVAALALFLASDRASFCTGGGYVVDGGLTASLF